MTQAAEPTQIGLSDKTHAKLKRLKEDGHFAEMADAYRCGIAMALAHGVLPDEVPTPRTTIFSVSSVDPAGDLATAIKSVMVLDEVPVYRMAERLAEWGIQELSTLAEKGEIDFPTIIDQVQAVKDA